jgi:hypothetical protein
MVDAVVPTEVRMALPVVTNISIQTDENLTAGQQSTFCFSCFEWLDKQA